VALGAAFPLAVSGARAQGAGPEPAAACAAARAFLDRQLVGNEPREIETCETAIVAGRGTRWVTVFDVRTVGRTAPPVPVLLSFQVVMTYAPGQRPPWRLETIEAD
jgi:hypothetical protein